MPGRGLVISALIRAGSRRGEIEGFSLVIKRGGNGAKAMDGGCQKTGSADKVNNRLFRL